eukprot:1142825-Pelagomonas_calceolata.AAC.1
MLSYGLAATNGWRALVLLGKGIKQGWGNEACLPVCDYKPEMWGPFLLLPLPCPPKKGSMEALGCRAER